jgi:hypothetical protein
VTVFAEASSPTRRSSRPDRGRPEPGAVAQTRIRANWPTGADRPRRVRRVARGPAC